MSASHVIDAIPTKSAEERPQSMTEVSEALDRATTELGAAPFVVPQTTPHGPITWPPRDIQDPLARPSGERAAPRLTGEISLSTATLTPARAAQSEFEPPK